MDLVGEAAHRGDALIEQARVQIEDMKLIKVIDADTDADALAVRCVFPRSEPENHLADGWPRQGQGLCPHV